MVHTQEQEGRAGRGELNTQEGRQHLIPCRIDQQQCQLETMGLLSSRAWTGWSSGADGCSIQQRNKPAQVEVVLAETGMAAFTDEGFAGLQACVCTCDAL